MSLLTNLVAGYRFETGLLTTDCTNNSKTLTNNGTVAESASGKFGYCADYGSANTTKYFNRADNLGIDGGAITISSWIKLNTEIGAGTYAIALQGSVTSQVNNILVYEYNAGTRRLGVNRQKQNVTNNTSYGNVTLGTSTWHNVIYRYDGTNISGWLNGVKICADVATSGNGASAATSNLSLGFENQFSAGYASMLQDSTFIWSRALSDAEIAQVSASKDYPFMESFSDTFEDASIDTAKWTTAGSVSEASGFMTFTGASGQCTADSVNKYMFTPGCTFETYGNITRTTASGHYTCLLGAGGPATAYFYSGWNLNANIHVIHTGDTGSAVDTDTGIAASTTATKHKFVIKWLLSGQLEYWIDDVLKYTSTVAISGSTYPMYIRLCQVYDSGHVMQFDYATVTMGGVVKTLFGNPNKSTIINSSFW